jgi:hypothetical protein
LERLCKDLLSHTLPPLWALAWYLSMRTLLITCFAGSSWLCIYSSGSNHASCDTPFRTYRCSLVSVFDCRWRIPLWYVPGAAALSLHASSATSFTSHSHDVLLSTAWGAVVLRPPVASALILDIVPKSSVFVRDEVTRSNPSCFSSIGARRLRKFISLAAETMKHFIPRRGDLWRIIQELQRHTNTLTHRRSAHFVFGPQFPSRYPLSYYCVYKLVASLVGHQKA